MAPHESNFDIRAMRFELLNAVASEVVAGREVEILELGDLNEGVHSSIGYLI